MSEIITEESDLLLWTLLHNSFVNEGRPRDVTRGTDLYRVRIGITEEISFVKVDPLAYIDSRSLTNSKKATYKKLDG